MRYEDLRIGQQDFIDGLRHGSSTIQYDLEDALYDAKDWPDFLVRANLVLSQLQDECASLKVELGGEDTDWKNIVQRVYDTLYLRGDCGGDAHYHDHVFAPRGPEVWPENVLTEIGELVRKAVEEQWVIVHVKNWEYWNNETGWGSLAGATRFPHPQFNLPVCGHDPKECGGPLFTTFKGALFMGPHFEKIQKEDE